ncbi:MAG: glycosyltransferase [Symploca sp. SIO3C6]|nr:glycosyltransferase [Symploca sp. SIO3C6]
MLAICKYLLNTSTELSILLISGSPVLHSFRMPQGLDYIKLPCLGRDESGKISAKFLRKKPQEVTRLRSEIIKTAIINFEPDLILVDKKPYGLQGELKSTLIYLEQYSPQTKLVLLLRDIIDAPSITIEQWRQNNYYQALQYYYDQILVVGMPEIFDITKEYNFPENITSKTRFCGYIDRDYGYKKPQVIRQELNLKADEKLVLVTPGGGGDGYHLVKTYLQGLEQLPPQSKIRSLVIYGPEMPKDLSQNIWQLVQQFLHVHLLEFTDDLASYINAADTVICMGGYNTICEVLSLKKKAIVIPRMKPVQEQWIRAQRMGKMGLFMTINPNQLTPKSILEAVLGSINHDHSFSHVDRLDLKALPRISYYLYNLVYGSYYCFFNNKEKLYDIIDVYSLRAVS